MGLENFLLNLDDNFLVQINSLDGKIDLTIGVVCAFLAYAVSQWFIGKFLVRRINPYGHHLVDLSYYLLRRAVFPLVAISFFVINYARFSLMTTKSSVIYPALIWLALWLLLIRIVTGIIIFVVPRGALRFTLDGILSFLFWVAYVVWWSDSNIILAHWLKAVNIRLGPIHFTLLALVYALITAVIIIAISLWLNKFIELKINQTSRFDSTFKHVILRISKLIIFVVIILSVLPVLGIDITTLSVFSGALGVGIGIGLQKFLGNIFSGIMILMDRSIKIGDRLVIGEHTGYVSKITSRHIVLQSLDNSEILVPNEKFIFETIVNQSYTDTTLLIKIPVGVAYGSDLKLALSLLIEAAKDNPVIDHSRTPQAGIENFGDFAIDLILLVWVKDPKISLIQPKTDIYLRIGELFAESGIEIPLPQQVVRLHH